MLLARLMLLLLSVLMLAGCTAIKVVTHSPSEKATRAPAGLYRLDEEHRYVGFAVNHFGYSDARGRFDQISGTLDFDPQDPTASRLDITIATASVSTGVEAIDDLLKGREFFRVDSRPTLTFRSTAIRLTGETTGEIDGVIRFGDRSAQVTLDTVFNGYAANPLTGTPTLGFSASTRLDRSKLGLGAWIPAVGNEVTLTIEAEFLKEKEK